MEINNSDYLPLDYKEKYKKSGSKFIKNSIIFVNNKGNIKPYIIRYYAEDEISIKFNKNLSYNNIPAEWSGRIDVFTYDERHLKSFTITGGKIINYFTYKNVEESSKKTTHETLATICNTFWVDFPYYPISGGVGSSHSVQITVCHHFPSLEDSDPDSGGGGGGDFPIGGGGCTGCNGNPGDGDAKICDSMDDDCIPSPGTEPYTSFGFPVSPRDGDKYTLTYPNGRQATFTYNSELGGWLMPEFQALIDMGYIIQNTHTFPSFNGQIITLIAAPAFAEPTFIGEIILGGAALVVTTMYVYDILNYYYATISDSTYDICLRLWEQCDVKNKGFASCTDCMRQCNTQQGEWPFNKCYWD